MQNWKTEYKLLLILGIIFSIILLFFLFRSNYIENLQTSYRQNQLVTCTEEEYEKGIEYTDYSCIIKDEYGDSYTIEYPQIKEKNKDIKAINSYLKKTFDETYNSVKYYEEDNKLMLSSYQKINYEIYNSKGIVSFLIENQDISGEILNSVNQYKIYNIDTSTYEVLDNDEMKEKLGIDRAYSSKLRGIVVKMYLEKFRYDYNNELPIYRNKLIDASVEDVVYGAINNIYLDNNGNIRFVLYLYNPNYAEKVPYNFCLDSNGNTTYEVLG